MPHAHVFWFMNFLPGGQRYLADIGKSTAPHGVVGGPDVMPDNRSLTSKVYPVYDLLKGVVPLFARVEAVCYHHEHADKAAYPTKFWTPLEQFNYAKTRLAANYMFWVRVPKPPVSGGYDYFDALKVMADNPVWSPSL